MEELESLKQQLEELKKLRSELRASNDLEDELIDSEVEDKDISTIIKKQLDDIDSQIKELEEEVKKNAKEYEETYKRLQIIIDEYKEKTESTKLLSEEEIQELTRVTEELKLSENERSAEIKSRLDAQKKIIRQLKSKKTKIQNNLMKAEALGLTYEEFNDITSVLRKTSIMNSILEKKGLSHIIEKSAKERTKEEKELLKETKKEVLEEVSKVKVENKEYSILEAIEVLYSLDTSCKKEKESREIQLPSKDVEQIKENKESLPYRIVSNSINNNYTPEPTPEDMQEIKENEDIDFDNLKPAEERVTLFKDINSDNYYARKYAVKRFKLKSADLDNEVRIDGSLCYKISEEDVDKIRNNANNSFSPYIADIKEITLENTKDDIKEEKFDNIISEEDTINELIPGTNIKKPRWKKINETDEEYEEFLKKYYEKVFPQEKQEINDGIITDEEDINDDITIGEDNVNERVTLFKDTNSNDYYVRKYVVKRYKLKNVDLDNEVRINGSLCYKISEEEKEKLQNNANNSLSPYIVDIKDIDLNKDESLDEEDIKGIIDENLANTEEKEESLDEEDIKGIIDENLANTEEKEESLDEEDIKGIIDENLANTEEKEESLNEEDIKGIIDENLGAVKDEEEIEEIPYEEVLKQVEKEKKEQEKKYTPTNIRSSKKFKKELKKGGFLYNIVHVVPGKIKLGIDFLKRLASKLFKGKKNKDKEVDAMIDEYINSENSEKEEEVVRSR